MDSNKIVLEEFNNEEINNDINEMNEVLSENFTAFLVMLEEGQDGMTRDSENKDEEYMMHDEGISFYWTDKVMKLIDEEKKKIN